MNFFSPIDIKRGADKCVVLLSGYTGGAGAFSSIIDLFDCDIISYQYPGHGGDYRSFSSTSAESWLIGAMDFVSDIRGIYREVTLCGYSMGGAISILISKEIDIDMMFLFAPALVSHSINKLDRRPVDFDAINPRLKALCDSEDLDIIKFYLRHDNADMQTQLETLVSKARSVERITCPAVAFIGKKDLVEDYQEETRMCELLGIKMEVFEESTHAILYDENHSAVVSSLKNILSLD